MYAKQYSNFTIISDSNKADNVIFKNVITFVSGNCSVNQTERLPVHSLQFKKAPFDRISFEQMGFIAQYVTPFKSHKNVFSALTPSILQLICILRI
jgi:hypothetical protein